MDKYIEINKLSNPEKAFERMEDEFTDIMYADHYSENSVVMLLDVNIDPLKEAVVNWLKSLLDPVLYEIGESQYIITPFYPEQL